MVVHVYDKMLLTTNASYFSVLSVLWFCHSTGDRMWNFPVPAGQVLGFWETKLAEMSGSGGVTQTQCAARSPEVK